jgi:flagellar biosynthesis protein FlhB
MLPFLIGIVLVALFAPMLIGGFNFSVEAFAIKLDRLDPIKGLKKIISLKSLIELIKAIMKFSLICICFVALVNYKLQDVFSLDQKAINLAVNESANTVLFTMLIISMPLILVSLIDVPFQIWDNAKQLKMTKQEIKDEMKDTEGKPEVKSKLKALQRELRKRRMMSNVAKADVVITNPTHFAVAIKYDEMRNPAPIVLAKGTNLVAEMIKKVAKANGVPFVSAPALARAIYFNVEIDEEVPSGLYVAVAKVLAYIYELRLYNKGDIDKPVLPSNLSIPKEFKTEG